MQGNLIGLAEALEQLASAGGERAVGELSSAELVAVNGTFGVLRRRLEAAHAPVAAEISRQSRRELGKDSLAKKQGFRNPVSLISATTGGSFGDAKKLVQVGEATAPRATISGEEKPAKHPHVAKALAAGQIGMAASAAIVSMLDRVELRADRAALDDAERRLVGLAPGMTPDQLHKLIVRAEAELDPAGVEPQDAQLRDERSVTVREDRDGAVCVTARLDPESGAFVKTVLEGMVTLAIRRRDDARTQVRVYEQSAAADGGGLAGAGGGDGTAGVRASTAGGCVSGAGSGEGLADERSVKQMQADALVDLCRHALGCETVPTGANTTVVIRVGLEELESRAGVATIDGLDRPVSIETARRAAVDAQTVPSVFGSKSEILDLGRRQRYFTQAQKLAIAERDGGCARCGAPPGFTSVHHIRWWAAHGGKTDLSNGVLLCTGCHHMIHDNGWRVEIRGIGTHATAWFTPPASADPTRTPQRGLSAHLGLAA